MKINSAVHVTTAVKQNQYPEADRPEVAFAGRSNVGKSSMINSLVNRKRLAYVGATPGKTRQINFFCVNDEIRLVDLPGYGYAKVAKSESRSWGALTNTYLRNRKTLRLIVLLIDIRHKPTLQDVEMTDWLKESGIPFAVCAVKSDKITRGNYRKHVRQILDTLNLPDETPVVIFSSANKEGVDELWEIIEFYCKKADEVIEQLD
ncbi:MAG: YihA family ribosome biogenesis GTP-binding protein [Clostridia bacterium]|nr:YihA family ribosome biogenesis GTP-binding protein [Clostridia bacterium]MBN2882756.1 YihA family ribosome biogenesis GTP-binding protein [Clostridia bacterium]